MPFKLYKSHADKIAADFPAEVEKHRQALLAHRFAKPAQNFRPAMEAIPATPDTPAIPAKGKFPGRPRIKGFAGRPASPELPAIEGEARPIHDQLVEACIVRVQREGQADDFVADYEIIDDTPPPPPPPTLQQRKDRLINEILLKETKLLNAAWPVGKRRLDNFKAQEVLKKKPEAHTPDEKLFLADLTAKQDKVNDISYRTSVLTSAIEDLTEETIGSWKGELTE